MLIVDPFVDITGCAAATHFWIGLDSGTQLAKLGPQVAHQLAKLPVNAVLVVAVLNILMRGRAFALTTSMLK